MLRHLVPLLAVLVFSCSAINVDQPVYWTNLATNLTAAGLNLFLNALTVANTTQLGQDLLNDLYQDDQSFTIYAAVDAAWQASGLQNPPANRDLTSLLSYHVAGAEINSTTDVAAPRQHTIYETALRTETVLLPGDRHQVIVLEQAPNATQGTILIRGDSWNATSSGAQISYENLKIQPIDKILSVPSPLIKTLSLSGLASRANLGATDFVDFANELNISRALEECVGCTFFVPVNDAFQAVNEQVSALNATEQVNLLRNHVLNGTLKYSPEIGSGFTEVTAAGDTLAFASNSSGSYFISGGSSAQILRADIPVSNGVVHLIDAVFVNTASNAERADEAVSSASSAAEAATGGSPVIGSPSASSSSPAQSTNAASALHPAVKVTILSLALAAVLA